jgi:hypothetical protein
MAGRDRRAVALSIGWRRLLSTKAHGLALGGFILLLAYLWAEDSLSTAFKAFLYLHPFLSLFFSQDIVSDEIASGALENVIFIEGRFRHYLLLKPALVAAAGLGVSLALFLCFSAYGWTTHQLFSFEPGRLAAGLLVGLYYVAAAGALSFCLRAGSNVLIIILGQFVLAAGLLVSASQRMGLIERLTSAAAQGTGAQFEFLSVSFILPNIVIARPSRLNLLGLVAGTAFFTAFMVWKIRSLELRRR